MRRLSCLIILFALLFSARAYASVIPSTYGVLNVTPPATLSDVFAGFCDNGNIAYFPASGNAYFLSGCPVSPVATQFLPATVAQVTGLTAALAGKFDNPSGTGSQYLDGTGAARNFIAPSRMFNYPTRAIGGCYQVSASNDADFHYNVDVTTGLSLTTGAQGTVSVTSYTNSGCSTGAQALASGTSGQSGTLVVGLGLNNVMSVGLNGTVQAGKWLKIATANTVGTPSYSLRADQAEIILP